MHLAHQVAYQGGVMMILNSMVSENVVYSFAFTWK